MGKTRRPKKGRNRRREEGWPLVVYMWIAGLGLAGYLFVGELALRSRPHPLHWAVGLLGGAVGAGVGWLWYRWRGDVV